MAIFDNFIPCCGKLCDASFAQGIHVVISHRQRDGIWQAINFAIERTQFKHCLVIPIFGKVSFGCNERFQGFCNAFFNQHRLPIQALKCNIRQISGHRLTQNRIGPIFIVFIRRSELYVDIRMCLFELRHHPFHRDIKKRRIGVPNFDFHSLC